MAASAPPTTLLSPERQQQHHPRSQRLKSLLRRAQVGPVGCLTSVRCICCCSLHRRCAVRSLPNQPASCNTHRPHRFSHAQLVRPASNDLLRTDYWTVFSRWLSQVRETTSSLLQVSLYEKGMFRPETSVWLGSALVLLQLWARMNSLPGADCHTSVAGDCYVCEGRILRQSRQQRGISKPEEFHTKSRKHSRRSEMQRQVSTGR